QVISRISAAFKVEVPLRVLFESPTVRGLAAEVEKAREEGSGLIAPAIERVSRERELPFSFAQQRLWFIQQLEPESAAYNSSKVVRLRGVLDIEAVRTSFSEVVRRHEVLRTVYRQTEAGPVQEVEDRWEVRVPVVDLSEVDSGEERAKKIVSEEAQQAFELERGPVVRVMVVRLGREEHLLSVTVHHIASDGWSVGILVREFTQLYEAYVEGREAGLEELGVQYADYAVWQRGWLSGKVLEEQMSYWRTELDGLDPLELPTDHPRPLVSTHRGARVEFALNRQLSEQLRAVSQREGVTKFMTLLAGFQLVLGRYSGQEDVVVGTDVANRRRVETEGLIGFFINQLVIRTRLEGNLTVRKLLRNVREVALGAYAHQDLPFEKLVEELAPPRYLSRTPLFEVKLVLQNAPGEVVAIRGLKLVPFENEYLNAKFDLMFFLEERGGVIEGTLEYATDLFDRSSMERLVRHYERALEFVAGGAEQELKKLVLLSEEERRQVIWEWNATKRESERWESVQEMFTEQAEVQGDRVAVVSEGRSITYKELNRRANKLGHLLIELDVGPEGRVAIYLERSEQFIIALMGALKAGSAYVPLDTNQPAGRLARLLEDAQVSVIITSERLVDNLPASLAQVVVLDADRAELDR